MALVKRNRVWHTHFVINGKRFRVSLKTSDWREAQNKERELIGRAERGELAGRAESFARSPFNEAAETYLASRKLELQESSYKKESHLLAKPKKFFGTTRVDKIDAESLLAYREKRATENVRSATINMELGVIRRILKRARRWHLVGVDIRPLRERHSVGRAMTYEEKTRLLHVASTKKDWQSVRLAMLLALNTTMRGCEIKGLRWRDIDFLNSSLTIRKSKTDAGERLIPLNNGAVAVLIAVRERAKSYAGVDTDHYVFAACENEHYDPTHAQKSWRSAWRALTRMVTCPKCTTLQNPAETCANEDCDADLSKVKSPLAGLRFHDLRHHAITELAESQASDQTVMAIAGHVSQKMLAHYSHVRTQAKRQALDAICTPLSGGYDTKHDTKHEEAAAMMPQVIENTGRPEWTRTIDLFRVKTSTDVEPSNKE